MSIGGGANDLLLCQASTPDRCTGSDLAEAVDTVQANPGRILRALRHRAHYHRRIVVLTYHSLDDDAVGSASMRALARVAARAFRR